MPSTSYNDFINQIVPITPGAPPPLVDTVVRQAATEFCTIAGVWLEELAPIDSVVDQDEYTLASANTDGMVHFVHSVFYDDVRMGMQEWESFQVEHPDHPNTDAASTPYKYTMKDRDTLSLFPVPPTAVTDGIVVRCSIIPTKASTGLDSNVASDYEEAIIHGALHRLLLMPNKEWTEMRLADYYGRKFRADMAYARSRISKGYLKRSEQVGIPKSVPISVSIRKAI